MMSSNNSSNRATGDRNRDSSDTRPPVFRNLNPVSQLLPSVCDEFIDNGLAMEPSENRPSISLPEEFFKFNSTETRTLLSVLLDSSNSRMVRLLERVHMRAMFREDRYYQIVDDPSLYCRSKCSDLPAFQNQAVLYLTTPGVLIYLKQTDVLSLLSEATSKGTLPRTPKMITRRESRQSKRKQPQADFEAVLAYEKRKKAEWTPFINIDAYQYATYVHCYCGDILRFQLDFLAVKRHYQEALPILMSLKWQPKSPSVLLYRRRYYQYMTPFLDWVDMMRYQLKTSPTLSVAGFFEKLLETGSEDVEADDLRYMGHTMLEYIELRRLTRANCSDVNLHGLYAGRKLFRDKEPRIHCALKVFTRGNVVRPVLPHACSPLRRFLVHLNYYDRQYMASLPQMLSLVEFMLHQEFFSMHPFCKVSGIHCEPLVFQIYDFVWSIRKGHIKDNIYLRHEPWESIRVSEDSLVWYQRWDVLNCICLLFGIFQNAIERDAEEHLIERTIKLIINVLRSSEFLESFMSFSYFDTYLGMSSTVNTVPNLSLSCLLRVLRTAPFHLCHSLTITQALDSFSDRFWRSGPGDPNDPDNPGGLNERPQNMHQIGKFMMNRNRRVSVKQAPATGNSDAVSGMSAVGSTGAVVLFYRNFFAMPVLSPEDEASAVNDDRVDATRRQDEEQQHLADYRQMETDYRYGRIFTESYVMATGRPRMTYNENLSYHDCRVMSLAPYTLRHDD